MADNARGHGCLFFASLGTGVFLSYRLAKAGTTAPIYVFAGLAAGLLYPVFGAGAVWICQNLWRWAFPDERDMELDLESRTFVGAVWPIALLVSLVVSPFFAIINRLYRD